MKAWWRFSNSDVSRSMALWSHSHHDASMALWSHSYHDVLKRERPAVVRSSRPEFGQTMGRLHSGFDCCNRQHRSLLAVIEAYSISYIKFIFEQLLSCYSSCFRSILQRGIMWNIALWWPLFLLSPSLCFLGTPFERYLATPKRRKSYGKVVITCHKLAVDIPVNDTSGVDVTWQFVVNTSAPFFLASWKMICWLQYVSCANEY